jgi:Tfp pilus assembly protein PilF
MQSIARQTDDPQILGANKAAIDLNIQGVRTYKAGNLDEAQDLFRRALALQAKNISIALNLAQALLHSMASSPSASKLEECRACLKMVGKMPDSDPRFERYQKLQNKAFGA